MRRAKLPDQKPDHGRQKYRAVPRAHHSVRNQKQKHQGGEDHDLHSVAEVLEFDPATSAWKEMPKLPEPRSSFDATIADGKLYVVGGWVLGGESEESEWATDALVLDLNKTDAGWTTLEAPFTTRALAVRAHHGKLVAVGGIVEEGGTTAEVHVYDIAKGTWSEGPELPCKEGLKAFGCSAVSLGDHLLVSTYDGGIYRLSDDWKSWEVVHQLDVGRFFHQMVPAGEGRFALIGGSHMEQGSQNEVAVYELIEKGRK